MMVANLLVAAGIVGLSVYIGGMFPIGWAAFRSEVRHGTNELGKEVVLALLAGILWPAIGLRCAMEHFEK